MHAVNFLMATLVQITRFMTTLDAMERQVAGRFHRVEGELAIAGKLTSKHIMGTHESTTGATILENGDPTTVWCSDSASIRNGAWVVRTDTGSVSHGRQHSDQYAYIPFRSKGGMNHCVMKIKQFVLVQRTNMGWRGDEARLAVGTLFDHLAVRHGAGLETQYNDDPTSGACCVPRALHATSSKLAKGSDMAVFLRQVHCSCVYIPGKDGCATFMTLSKMGIHGRRDLGITSSDFFGELDEICRR